MPSPRAPTSITLLHLSDIQFGPNHRFATHALTGDDAYKTLLQTLLRDLSGLEGEDGDPLQPDLILLTGDLAEHGMKAEFDEVHAFCAGLCEGLGLARSRLLIVPGNHDINWKTSGAYFLECEGEGVEPKPPFWPKWKYFHSFFQDFYRDVPAYQFTEQQPWSLYEIPELKVVVAGLNSTIAESHREADHHGQIGLAQLRWFEKQLRGYRESGWLRLCMLHHNVRNVSYDDNASLVDWGDLKRNLGSVINAVFHGHTHGGGIDALDFKIPILSTGSGGVQLNDRPLEVPNQYQVVQIRPDGFSCFTRAYAVERTEWIADMRIGDGNDWRIARHLQFEEVHGTFSDAPAPIPQALPESPALVIEGAPENRDWSMRLAASLRPLGVPFWEEADGGDSEVRLADALAQARVVIVLVSEAMLRDTARCDTIYARLQSASRGLPITARALLIEHCAFESHRLFKEIRPVNEQQPLNTLDRAAQDRVLSEVAARVLANLTSAFRLRTKDLLVERPTDVETHLGLLVDLLAHAGPYLEGVLDAVRDIATYLLQEILGSGTKAAWGGGDRARLIEQVLVPLRRVQQRQPGIAEEAMQGEIVTVIRCLEALSMDASVAEAEERSAPLEVPLQLLPRWVDLADQPVVSDVAWSETRDLTLRKLTVYFTDRYNADGNHKKRPLPLVRIFHSLWFCILILKGAPPHSARIPTGLRPSLAYVLREGLRFLCFGYADNEEQRRPYYFFDMSRYATELRALVGWHAGQILGDPTGKILGPYLTMIGRTDGVGRNFAAEHLQHIMEVYIAGHLVLNLRLGGPEGLAFGAALRGAQVEGEAAEAGLTECRQAFTLAALFHDVGHLVVPRTTRSADDLGLQIPALQGDLAVLFEGMSAAVNQLALRGVEALSPFAAGDGLASWLAEQPLHPGHALLSAYYLFRVQAGIPLTDWVRRSALRSVLHHNALEVQISADSDPVSVLLILCDELFEWDPSQPAATGAIGRSLQVFAPEVPAHEPRDRLISIGDVRLASDLTGWLHLGDANQPERWPTIHVDLQGPQRLAVPVYHLWLRKSRNLGRILPSTTCGFGPVLWMSSRVVVHGKTIQANFNRIEADLPLELRPAFREWMRLLTIKEGEQVETAQLGALPGGEGFYKQLGQIQRHLKASMRED